MPLKRTTHWATRELNGFLRARRSAPFAWGVNDCALFASDAIEAFTGVDIAADFRVKGEPHPEASFSYRPGDYDDEASAFALIAKVTGKTSPKEMAVGDAAEWCAAQHGLREWKDGAGNPRPLLAQRGDLVTVDRGDGMLIAGIVHLNGRHVAAMGADGPLRLPLTSVKRAWHV